MKWTIGLLLVSVGFVQSLLASCAGITNANTSYVFVLSGYNGGGAYCTSACSQATGSDCYQTLPSNASQAVQIPAGTWVYLQYDVCTNVSYNDQGQAQCGGNIGYI